MNRLSLVIILIITLFAQMNPASCAGEWSVALPSAHEDGNPHVQGDTAHNNCPAGSHEEAEDFCQCPCHLTFQTSLHHADHFSPFNMPPYPDYHSPILTGFTGDIFRPPLYL